MRSLPSLEKAIGVPAYIKSIGRQIPSFTYISSQPVLLPLPHPPSKLNQHGARIRHLPYHEPCSAATRRLYRSKPVGGQISEPQEDRRSSTWCPAGRSTLSRHLSADTFTNLKYSGILKLWATINISSMPETLRQQPLMGSSSPYSLMNLPQRNGSSGSTYTLAPLTSTWFSLCLLNDSPQISRSILDSEDPSKGWIFPPIGGRDTDQVRFTVASFLLFTISTIAFVLFHRSSSGGFREVLVALSFGISPASPASDGWTFGFVK